MQALAVLLEKPEHLTLSRVGLIEPEATDVVVNVQWSGISTGTERLLWSGRMPPFPGLGYPLVPGYESVGKVAFAGPDSGRTVGETVFVPGSRGFTDARGLFGGAASRVVAAGAKVLPIDETIGRNGVLLALAATAHHALHADGARLPELIVGHGVLGRLIARLAVIAGACPTVWETNLGRHAGADGYTVMLPDADSRRDYRSIYEVSGEASLMDGLVQRLAPGGEITLAGFYDQIGFSFAPAFMREARLRIAAEFKPDDLKAVLAHLRSGALSLDGLLTHGVEAARAAEAYHTAFTDPSCLKMTLDWRATP